MRMRASQYREIGEILQKVPCEYRADLMRLFIREFSRRNRRFKPAKFQSVVENAGNDSTDKGSAEQ